MSTRTFISCLVIMLLVPAGMSFASGEQDEYVRANRLYAQGKYAEALVLYQSVVTSTDGSADPGLLYTRIGDSYFQTGNYRNALAAYRRAIMDQKLADRPQTQYWIGLSCIMLGRMTDAVSEFLKIPVLYPNAGMWVGTAYYWAARASERLGRKEQAAEFYRKAAGTGKTDQGRFALEKAKSLKQGAGRKREESMRR